MGSGIACFSSFIFCLLLCRRDWRCSRSRKYLIWKIQRDFQNSQRNSQNVRKGHKRPKNDSYTRMTNQLILGKVKGGLWEWKVRGKGMPRAVRAYCRCGEAPNRLELAGHCGWYFGAKRSR